MLRLAHGLAFEDLYRRDGLVRLDGHFLAFLEGADPSLRSRLIAARGDPDSVEPKAESQLLLDLAPSLERFLAELFGIVDEVARLKDRHDELAPLYRIKRQFVQRRAATKIKPAEAETVDADVLERELRALFGADFSELAFATHVDRWLADESGHPRELDLALKYAAWALHTATGRARHTHSVLFKQPVKIDPFNLLVHAEKSDPDGVPTYRIAPDRIRRRDGFKLTDPGMDLVGALDQTNYCI